MQGVIPGVPRCVAQAPHDEVPDHRGGAVMRAASGWTLDSAAKDSFQAFTPGLAGPVWAADGQSFDPARITPIRHSLCGHPLLQLPRLRQLAESFVGTRHLNFVLPNRKKNSAFYTLSEAEAKTDIRHTFDQLESPGTWVGIYFAEADPDYRELITSVLDSMKPMIEPLDPGMHGYGLFFFIAAPPTVTPFHIDRENNFNIQILGRKRLRIWPATDRQAVPDEAVEEFFVNDSLGKLRLREELEPSAVDLEIGPGEGVYFPTPAGHFVTTEDKDWVKPGDGVSVSMALTYFTAATRRRAHVYLLNQCMRQRFSAQPTSPGTSGWVDAVKDPLAMALLRYRQLRHHKAIPRGM